MTKGNPIEILMATYDGAPYIREQIDSILAQTDENWRLTLSDDGSTDGTDAIIDEYAARYPDRVRRVHSGRRFGGAMPHFMWLTENCDAAYIAYCDDDDTWKPDKLEKLRAAMLGAQARLGGETPILVFADQTVTRADGGVIAPSLMRYQKQYFGEFDWRSILMQNVVTGGAMMVNRLLAQMALRSTVRSQIIMHDWWMAAVAARFGEIVYIDEPLGTYRQHGANSVGAKDVGSAAHMLHKLSHIGEIQSTIRAKKAQACVFEQTYSSGLSREDLRFLHGYTKERSGPVFYWRQRAQIHGLHRLAGMMLLG